MRCLLFFIVSFAVSGIGAPAITRAESPATSAVGVINLKLVYDNMQATIDSQKQLADMQKELDRLVEFHKADRDAKISPINLSEQTIRTKMIRQQVRQLKRAYDQIQAVVADLAKTKGFDLVLVGTSTNLPASAADIVNPQTTAGLVFNRTVLYASDKVDITAEVIGLLNQNYKIPADIAPIPALPTTSMRIGSRAYTIEIAADTASQEHGLMERDTMAADHGMIFAFPDSGYRSFWMHHTRIPLDIIFADDHGKIVSTHTMKPYDESDVPSEFPAKYAVELSAGEVAANGVKPGDILQIPATLQTVGKK